LDSLWLLSTPTEFDARGTMPVKYAIKHTYKSDDILKQHFQKVNKNGNWNKNVWKSSSEIRR